tara:strand:- start:82 stop:213 length:132 start_codon:yes stop_codon:yes gene_type:complete
MNFFSINIEKNPNIKALLMKKYFLESSQKAVKRKMPLKKIRLK